MKIIDCEKLETIYTPINGVVGISKQKLDEIFQNIDLEESYAKNPDF